jgi:hypothetical protein
MNDNDNNNENIAEFMAYSHINSRYIFSFYKYFFKKLKRKEEVAYLTATSFLFCCKDEIDKEGKWEDAKFLCILRQF